MSHRRLQNVLLSRGQVGFAAVVGALVLPLLLPPSPAAAACAAPGSRSISGVVYGVDNKDVNVSIGFDVESTSGQIINVGDGCAKTGGYSTPVKEYNHYTSYAGAAPDSMQVDHSGTARGRTVRTWSLTGLPANARSVWIEVYVRDYKNYNNPSAMGPVNTAKYGFVTRRQVVVGSRNVMLRLPMSCSYRGGSNGGVAGTVRTRSGAAVTPDTVYAWSTMKDQNNTIMGWGIGTRSAGNYKVSALAANQPYVIQMTYQGHLYEKRGVTVRSCSITALNWIL
jgi:hypothetical protein